MDGRKRKNDSKFSRKFVQRSLIILILFASLTLSCNLFARLGGEWVSSSLIPVPPHGELINIVYAKSTYSDYILRHDIFTNLTSATVLRDWYINDAQVLLSPIPTGNHIIEYNGYYGTPFLFGISNTLKNLHTVSVWLATDWFDEQIATCQRVQVYFDFEKFTEDFPDVPAVNKSLTYTVVTTCWPNVK